MKILNHNDIHKRILLVSTLAIIIIAGLNLLTAYLCARKSYQRIGTNYTNVIEAKVTNLLNNNELSHSALQPALASFHHVENLAFAALLNEQQQIIASWVNTNSETDSLINVTMNTNDILAKNGHFLINRTLTANGKTYYLRTGLNIWYSYKDMFAKLCLYNAIITIIAIIAIILLLKYCRQTVIIPLAKLTEKSTAILKEGNYNTTFAEHNCLEVRRLEETFNKILAQLNPIFMVIAEAATNLLQVNNSINTNNAAVLKQADSTNKQAINSLDSMQRMMTFFYKINEQVGKLYQQISSSYSTINDMDKINELMLTSISNMDSAVSQSTNSINQLANSIRDNATQIANVDNALHSVTTAMQHITDTISAEDEGTKQGLTIAQELISQIQKGFNSLQNTMENLQGIDDTAKLVSSNLNQLRHYAIDIGTILHDIEDINKQTNLLSVNAAILAAQAGEHGRGFSVVAQDIDTLAARITEATKHIASLIKTIQNESIQAIDATNGSSLIIRQGIAMGTKTMNVYAVLMESAEQSLKNAEQVSADAAALNEEAQTVFLATEELATTVSAINDFSKEQLAEADKLNVSTTNILKHNREVTTSTTEQANIGGNIMAAMNQFIKLMTDANKIQESQSDIVSNIGKITANIRDITSQQIASADQLNQLLSSHNEQAGKLLEHTKALQNAENS